MGESLKACGPAGLQNTAGNKIDSVSDKVDTEDAQDRLLTSVCVHNLKEKCAERDKVSILYTYRKRERSKGERREG